MKIWNINTSEAPRMMRLLTNTFLALSECGLSLVDLPRFLLDRDWRSRLIARTRYAMVAEYFRYEFPRSEGAIHQWVTPVLNKIGPLVFDPDVRLMLGSRSTIHFRQILDRELILLVNLSKGILSEGNSALLGAFIMAHLQQAALTRANTRRRELFFLYLDEFQNYTTDNIKDVLSESRKYGLSLILAHQYLDQLSNDLRGAVLNTTGTIACFRVGYHDASVLAKEIFPPGFSDNTYPEIRLRGWGRYLAPLLQEDNGQTHEQLASLLTNLKEREFWTKRRGPSSPVKQRTLDMPVPPASRELHLIRKQLLSIAGERYGRLKADVRKEWHERVHVGDPATTYYEKT